MYPSPRCAPFPAAPRSPSLSGCKALGDGVLGSGSAPGSVLAFTISSTNPSGRRDGGCFWAQTSWFGVRTPEHPEVPQTVPLPPECLFSAGSLLLEGALLLCLLPLPGGRGGDPLVPAGGLGAVQLAGSQRRVSHLSLRGAKCRQSRCGGRPFAPTPPRCQGRPEVPGGRGGGPRWVAQLLPPPHPQRPPRCARWAPAGCRRGARGKQTWASWAGRGVPAPFEAPIKEPSIKGGESQRNKESG